MHHTTITIPRDEPLDETCEVDLWFFSLDDVDLPETDTTGRELTLTEHRRAQDKVSEAIAEYYTALAEDLAESRHSYD